MANTPAFTGAVASSPQSLADSAILSGFADTTSFTRSFWPKLLERYPDRQKIENGLMAHLVDNKGFVGVQMNTTQVFHAEEDSVLQSATVVSFTGGASANAFADITITAQTYGGTPLYTNLATEGQMFQINGNPSISLRVSAVTLPSGSATHVIRVYPPEGVQIDAELAASGDILLPQDSVYASGATFPEGSTRGWNRYGVNFQYIMTSSSKIGKEGYNQTFEFTLSDGSKVLAPKLMKDALLTDMMRVSVAICKGSGELMNTPSGTVQTTTGVVTAAQVYGISEDYVAGAFQEQDFLASDDQLEAAGAGTEVDIFGGFAWLRSTQFNSLAAYQAGSIQFLSGEQYNAGTRAELKKTLGCLVFGKFVHELNEASEWGHKFMYSPIDVVTGTQTADYWTNASLWIPRERIDVPRALTNTSYDVSAPMFRVLQLASPVTMGGPDVMNRVFYVNPVNVQKEQFFMTIAKDVAAQTMLAGKFLFTGTA